MSELQIGPESVGQEVRNLARPEWGVGRILGVVPTRHDGQSVQRVSIQFAVGHRTLMVPPARLAPPAPEPVRASGWLDSISGRTLDDRLGKLPESVTAVLGTPVQRLAAAVTLYRYDESPASLLRWARDQAGVADALAHWTRDELAVSFRRFCTERDAHVRAVAAVLVHKEGGAALREFLAELASPVREAVLSALRKPL